MLPTPPRESVVRFIDLGWSFALGLLLCSQSAIGQRISLPAATEDFFPIGVWMQDPTNALRFRAAGINTYVGLWEGPTPVQLTRLESTGMRIVCHQNEAARAHPYATNIIAWMHQDEPDNAPRSGARFGLGDPAKPEQIVAAYHQMKAVDPDRPVFLNLGQGVAWDNWYGRGTRNRRPEDYPRYLQGCDIASFDIYPANHSAAEVRGNLWYVPLGVMRLQQWATSSQQVWNIVECTAIRSPQQRPSPAEVRAQVWMSLIHGSRGIIYFAHQFGPTFCEAALLENSEMLAAVTTLNQEVAELAPILNLPAQNHQIRVQSMNPALPIAVLSKKWRDAIHLYAVAMRPLEGAVEFTLPDATLDTRLEVIGENRELPVYEGRFRDYFQPWEVHLYRVAPER